MANLVSPGVNVTVVDESVSLSSGPGTVPFILIATGQDKLNSSNTAIAPGTAKANAGKLQLITSQRELLQQFGVPNFNTVGGSSQHGNELNEYGLLAAYSYLGNANRAYVMRADIDLNQLQPLDTAPRGEPVNGTYWLSTSTTEYAISIWDGTNWVPHTPMIADADTIDALGVPTFPGVNVGDFAVVPGVVEGFEGPVENMHFRWDGLSWIAVDTYPAAFNVTGVYPVGASVGDAWVNINLLSYDVQLYNSGFVTQEVPVLPDDAAANSHYGSELEEGKLYLKYSTIAPDSSEFKLMRYTNGTWESLVYEASATAPSTDPADGTLWYSNNIVVDILINDGAGAWEELSAQGITLTVQPTAPATPANGDLWVDTDQLDQYPVIYRYDGNVGEWVKIDNTDQTTPNGIVFADARPDNLGALDADAPDPLLYPQGMLLWNTRYSTMNVKKYVKNYTFEGTLIGDRWVSVSGNAQDGSLLAGRRAQRQVIVEAMAAAVSASDELRADSVIFNLIAAPGYPELIDEMIALNVDRKEKAFIIGDSPLRLAPSGSSLQAWALNENNAAVNGEDGLIAADPYLGIYYPACLTTNVDGESVVQPASHMVLRTYAFNDQVAYPWFAPAGEQRGRVSNAETVGYIDSEGEFVPVELNEGQRDVLYLNNINPIAQIPGKGLIVYGQKTRNPSNTALSRVNVARLINYIRGRAEELSKPFLFEPNDQLTRANVREVFDRFLSELVTLRAIFDYVVVVDESNNTPGRIDRNELWIDIAIAPTKSVEFINIPIRIRNTGDL